MASDGHGSSSEDSMWVILFVIFIFIGLPVILWNLNHTRFSYWGLFFAWKQLALIDWPFLPWVKVLRYEIATLAARPADVSFIELIWRMTQAGFIGGWIPIITTVYTIRTTLRHRSEKIRRAISVNTLPEIMSVHCPAVIPVLYYGNMMNENVEGQESREHPAEYAGRNKLINNDELDIEKTHEIFLKQLGPKISTLSDLTIYEQALFAIFASRVFDTFENNWKAQDMLDKLNRSCHYGKWKGKPGYPDFSVIGDEIKNYMKAPEAKELVNYFQYSSTFLHMLHLKAMERGKLVSSNFRWLKGIDRGLWYVLNATGRKVPCIESLIQIQTYRTEHLAWKQGLSLVNPPVDACIEALRLVLIKEGVLPKPAAPVDINIDKETENV
jgi:intracellular multiplication protein IcmP